MDIRMILANQLVIMRALKSLMAGFPREYEELELKIVETQKRIDLWD